MRCCAHIHNLIVKDGMSVMKVVLEKIRESVSFWRSTPKRVEKFKEACGQLGLSYSKKLALDFTTRWNSTFMMLETALNYKDVFPYLKQRETLYKSLLTNE
ncbi:hypothetical protein Syun_009997 [Stephania yunnanensis]|uniref:Uncharacterized protein n=1 Tax=Stephania yunnanensis TaxID=152371 RepID=A0AAP0PP78_9MAGN